MKHLTDKQRYIIAEMYAQKYSQKDISEVINKDKSTVSSEIRRNCDKRNGRYNADLAQRKTEERHRKKKKKIRLTEGVKTYIRSKLQECYSPEQIYGRSQLEGFECISTEAIYRYIWEDKKQGGSLYKHLRTRIKKRKKRGSKKDNRGHIAGKVSIENRPLIVEEKQRFGDYEVDLIIGKNHKKALLTLNDRATGMADIALLEGKNASDVKDKIIDILHSKKHQIHTITSDNGKEFSGHLEIAKSLEIDYYFAHPYSSWERGANENLNGLIREFFPKKSDFSLISEKEIQQVVDNLNNRPRKRFGFLTPKEVYLQKINHNGQVAFMT
jgi:transposase, IS30 family